MALIISVHEFTCLLFIMRGPELDAELTSIEDADTRPMTQ